MAASEEDRPDLSEYQLRLFVSGATRRSLKAVATVRAVCEASLAGRYSLEVIDIYVNPLSAREHQVFAVPTLLKLAPIPKRLFVGDMSDTAPLFAGLGLGAPVPVAATGGAS